MKNIAWLTYTPLSGWRRVRLAVIAILLSSVVLHQQIASMLVQRGDGLLASGSLQAADQVYWRAHFFAASSPVVAERISFTAYLLGDKNAERTAITVVHQALSLHHDDANLLLDDGLCAQRVGDTYEAAWAFAHAGLVMHDARYLVLAAAADARLGRSAKAAQLWRLALRYQPGFPPALAFVTKHRVMR